MKILTLNLKREYFEQIKSGIKTEEYRVCTPYWQKRLEGKSFDKIIIKLGYPKNSEIEKILEFKYLGYEIKTIKHKLFGNDPVKVYAIKVEQDNHENIFR
ncbi:ASCH domain-containing protein [Cetobacterium sp.]|uniref:ASCH domain-containing protein n=1 Tax=Cetobacterium sp. TaxID=2071632 RepID=UPI003EE7A70E